MPRLYFFSALLILSSFCCVAQADSEVPAATPQPARLAADWWSYFEPASTLDNGTFQQRIAAEKNVLQAPALAGALKQEHSALPQQIIEYLNTYHHLKYLAVQTAPLEDTTNTSVSYSIEETIERHASLRLLHQKLDAESEELNWLETVAADDRKQQSRQRNQYLAMDKANRDRTKSGLELMATKIQLEIRRLELEHRKQAIQTARGQAEQIENELDNIAERLTAQPTDIEKWQQIYSQANAQVKTLQNQSKSESITDYTGNINLDPAQTRFKTLLSIKRDIDVGTAELIASQAQQVLAVAQLILNESGQSTETNRSLVSDSQSLQEKLTQQHARLQRAIESIRDAASSQSGAKSLRDKTLAETVTADQALRKLSSEIESTAFVTSLLKQRMLTGENWFARTIAGTGHTLSEGWSRSTDLLGGTLFEISETPVTTLGLLRVVIILTAAWWMSKGLRRGIQRFGERRGAVSQSSLYTLGRILHYAVLSIGIIIGLSSIGIDFTKFALFASALGIGIGFGLQTLISNFVAGLIILFEKNLKVKDFVELESGVTGEVKEINMRSTLITTNDNVDIVVPNSEFVSGRVTNWTLREAHRRIHIPFGVAYGTSKELVKKAVLEAAANVPFTLMDIKSRHPQVWLVEFGDSSLNFELIVWLTPDAVKRPSGVQAAYLWEIETKLNEHKIEIPFPQRDLHLRSVFGKKDDAAHSMLPDNTKL